MMEIIAFCGLACHKCGAFIATKNDDDEKRKEISQQWSKQFNSDIKPEDINCDGCLSDGGNLFSYCKVCEIRKCAKLKELKNCAPCVEYPCQRLNELFKMVPAAKENLDHIKKGI